MCFHLFSILIIIYVDSDHRAEQEGYNKMAVKTLAKSFCDEFYRMSDPYTEAIRNLPSETGEEYLRLTGEAARTAAALRALIAQSPDSAAMTALLSRLEEQTNHARSIESDAMYLYGAMQMALFLEKQ